MRAKTNTYIKTPVRGEEPVFVVTGRKEDVALAKREILSAADHFSQIRASRKSNINSTLAFGQLMANTPGQTTVQVRVPYRVVGLVVGPKGATIKRIQQQTHTYIVTPSRDKEPVFEVTGLPENVDAARKEIEAHIAIRTGGASDFNMGSGPGGAPGSSGGTNGGLYFNLNDNNGSGMVNGSGGTADNDLFSTSGGLNSPFSSSSGNLDHVNSILNSDSNGFASFKTSNGGSHGHGGGGGGITLANLLSSENNFGEMTNGSRNVAWSNGTDSHDSGIGHSPPFDNNGLGGPMTSGSAFKGFMAGSSNGGPTSAGSNNHHDPTLNGIWGELNKVLGGLDLNGGGNPVSGGSETPPGPTGGSTGSTSSSTVSNENGSHKPFLSIGSRSSLDLGTLGRPLTDNVSTNNVSTTANLLTNQITANSMGRQLSLPTETTPTTLPGFNGILSSTSTSSNQEFLNLETTGDASQLENGLNVVPPTTANE